ncbi:MAG TPA: hypothetical protein VIQ23_17230 [Hanamia sp.]
MSVNLAINGCIQLKYAIPFIAQFVKEFLRNRRLFNEISNGQLQLSRPTLASGII